MDTKVIDQMSIEEKLFAMEQLWSSLCKDGNYPITPKWHENVLKERKELIDSGNANFITLEELRRRLI